LVTSDTTTVALAKELAAISVEQAKRLTRLIDNLLAYSRITDVTEAYQFGALSLDMLIPGVLREFSSRLAPEYGVDLRIEGDLPPVRGDATAIRLVFSNLIDNAIRYSADTPYLRVSARREGSAALVEVEDHGAGIPQTELAELTRKFFRGRSAGSGGSGLGLAIVDRIVKDHGGTLAIQSEVGKGTRVTVTFPLWPEAR
jgi:signal transduction histidine kinase